MKMGLGLGDTRQNYASDISMVYDEARHVYLGEMVSRGGVYRVEGPDAMSVSSQMNFFLELEYQEMMREVETQKKQEFGHNVGPTVMVQGHKAEVTRHHEAGRPILSMSVPHYHEARGISVGDAINIADLSMTVIALLSGNWVHALGNLAGMAAEDYLTHAHGGSHKKEQKVFAVMFGGILITATSLALLKKKLQLQKNRRIQIIMHHMRDHDKARDKARSADELLCGHLSSNIRSKKKSAEDLWRKNKSPQGQDLDWQSRAINLRNNLGQKRERANLLWAERV